RLCLFRVAPLDRPGEIFSDWATPRSVGILPRKPIFLAGRADNALSILINSRAIVLHLRIFVLRFDEAATNSDGIQFIGTYLSIEDFFAAYLRIEYPLTFLVFDDRNRQLQRVPSDCDDG